MKKELFLILFVFACSHAAVLTLKDSSVTPTKHFAAASGDTVLLEEVVYVEDSAVITFGPGVVVKAKNTASWPKPALVICRGGKIYAEGTRVQPVIFTSEDDNLLATENITREFNKSENPGLWGGIAILGKATTNLTAGTGTYTAAGTDVRAQYGGQDDLDSSGVLRYVSIRYAGSNQLVEMHDKMDDKMEMNGLALCAVGSRTVIEYVEVYKSFDDGFKFLGGAANARFLMSIKNGDNAFDFDEGYHGRLQHILGAMELVNTEDDDQYVARHENNTDTLLGTPIISHATYVSDIHTTAILFTDGAAGTYINSIFNNAGKINISNLGGATNSWSRLKKGELAIKSNIFGKLGAFITDPTYYATNDSIAFYLLLNKNDFWNKIEVETDQFFAGFNGTFLHEASQNLDLRPIDTLALYKVADTRSLDSTFFTEPVCYRGALNPAADTMWISGWTALSLHGYLSASTAPRTDLLPCVEPCCCCADTATIFVNDTCTPGDTCITCACTTWCPCCIDTCTYEISNRTLLSQVGVLTPLAADFYANNNIVHISYAIASPAFVTIEVYDLKGRTVKFPLSGYKMRGAHTLSLRLASGSYICRIAADNYRLERKITVGW
ncbi:MAG: hypothetical protein GF372_00225 [Candidatus Marinimicrobia bacterium]|nr:hypothetical protein [Candidatus Neomarinimicrobiota bacterium]